MLGLEYLEVILGETEALVAPGAPLPSHRVPDAREEIDVGDRIAEGVGAGLGHPFASGPGPRHAVLARGILREVPEDAVEGVLPDHPLARLGHHRPAVHLPDGVLLT